MVLIGLAIFAILMLAFAAYDLKHMYEVDTNDETFLEGQTYLSL